jgi:hypothetical protein
MSPARAAQDRRRDCRVQSPKTGNIINCKSCRGTCQRKCGACRSGQAPCGKCDKSGKLESWIEIETSERGHVGVGRRGGLQQYARV